MAQHLTEPSVSSSEHSKWLQNFDAPMMTLAPPSFCSSSAWLTLLLSKKPSAPSSVARALFDSPEESAIVRYPMALLYC